ncbi:hypothetical protein Btru_074964 [Bulinus truncatus]|nr:hypothetical protein Btru_074964 [Bulinus truncatus]
MNRELQRCCDLQDHSKNHFHSYLPKAANILQRSCKSSSSRSFIMPGLIRLNSVGEDSSVGHIPKIEMNQTGFRPFGLTFSPYSGRLKKSLTSPIMNSSTLSEKLKQQHWENIKPLDTPLNYNFSKYQIKGLGILNSSGKVKNNFHSFSSPDFQSGGMDLSHITLSLFQPEISSQSDKTKDILDKISTHSICQPAVKNGVVPACQSLACNDAQSNVKLFTAISNSESPSQENSNNGRDISLTSSEKEKCQNSTDITHDSPSSLGSDQSITDTSSDLSVSQEFQNSALSVLLTPRKVVKKGRPSSKKQKKRQRQKQKHLLNSSDESFSETENSNCVEKSFCKESTPVKSESKSSNQSCVLFTLQSDSDDQSDCEDSSSEWSLCDTSISPIIDCAFNVALSLDAIFKQTHIPNIDTVFDTAGESSSDSEISFLSLGDSDVETDSCELLVNSIDINEINAKWERCYPSAGFRSCKSVAKEKIENPSIKVHFAADCDLRTIYLVDSEDRCGIWQHYALDRDRFERRIQEAIKTINEDDETPLSAEMTDGSHQSFLAEFQIFLCYVNPAFTLVGYVMNTLCMVILHKSGLNKPSNILLSALVMADSINMLTNLNFPNMLKYFGPVKSKPGYCTWEYDEYFNTFLYVSNRFFAVVSVWGHTVNATIPMIITAERMMAVFFPMTFKKVVTARAVVVCCVCAYTLWLPWVIFLAFHNRLAYFRIAEGKFVAAAVATELLRDNYNFLLFFTVNVMETLLSYVPSCFICVGCTVIGIKIKLALNKRSKLSKQAEKHKWSQRTTLTLLTSCLIFAITHTINSLISAFVPLRNDIPLLTYFLIQFAEFVNLINCSSNFIVYMVCNRHLWKIFMGIIGKTRKA